MSQKIQKSSSSGMLVNIEDLEQAHSPYYRRPENPNVGYTGHVQDLTCDSHILEKPCKKNMIRGYAGFRPSQRTIYGQPIIPSEEEQEGKPRRLGGPMEECGDDTPTIESHDSYEFSNFRNYAKHMDIIERYTTAVQRLSERDQSQEMLLRLVQAKMSERVSSYAQQMVRTRKLFEAFDINHDGVLDENEFRECLEKINIQFDDIQVLALFAYFDSANTGFINWENFADHSMVHNPKGGTAVLPKMITATLKTGNYWQSSPVLGNTQHK